MNNQKKISRKEKTWIKQLKAFLREVLKQYLCEKFLNKTTMQTLVNSINEQIAVFLENAKQQVETGNKAAGGRARKISLGLEKLLKEFRKQSIEAGK